MYLAIKEMKKEKGRFITILLVTTLIAYLVYFLTSLAFGLSQANKTAIDAWNADGIIVTEASNKNAYASVILEEKLNQIDLSNLEKLNISSAVIVDLDATDIKEDVVFFGLDDPNSTLIPELIEGKEFGDDLEVVASESIKNIIDVELGDKIKVATNGREYTIVGFTKSSDYNTRPVVYANLDMVSQTMMNFTSGDDEQDATATATPNMPNNVSMLIAKESVGITNLEDVGLEYVTTDAFINNIPGYQAQLLTFGMMILALVAIAAVIIAIFMYIITMQKKSIFAVLKIQGINNGYITKSVIYQTVLVSIIGAGVGLLGTVATIAFLPKSVPTIVNPTLFAMIAFLFLVFAIVGSIFSARSILKIDPLDAL